MVGDRLVVDAISDVLFQLRVPDRSRRGEGVADEVWGSRGSPLGQAPLHPIAQATETGGSSRHMAAPIVIHLVEQRINLHRAVLVALGIECGLDGVPELLLVHRPTFVLVGLLEERRER